MPPDKPVEGGDKISPLLLGGDCVVVVGAPIDRNDGISLFIGALAEITV